MKDRPHASDKPITSRVVRRYYFNGKGYSTKQLAYRAKAKRLLLELVLGPWEERDDGYSEGCSWWALANSPTGVGTDQEKKVLDARFAVFFPHDESPEMVQPGCLHDPSADGCRHSYDPEYDRDGRLIQQWGDFEFESCKWSQEQWIKAKVRELMMADESKEVRP